jgi:hypothetical protein
MPASIPISQTGTSFFISAACSRKDTSWKRIPEGNPAHEKNSPGRLQEGWFAFVRLPPAYPGFQQLNFIPYFCDKFLI